MTIIEEIKLERENQIAKGYTTENDKKNNDEYQLVDAAVTLVIPGLSSEQIVEVYGTMPPIGWSVEAWVKLLGKSYEERLKIAATLLVAELERVKQ